MTDLQTIPCPRCGAIAQEVIYAQDSVRVGWYCPACGHFEKTTGRERLIEGK